MACSNLPALTQNLLRKVRKPQREMDLEDEVFGKSIVIFQIKVKSHIPRFEEDETVEMLELPKPSGYSSKLL